MLQMGRMLNIPHYFSIYSLQQLLGLILLVLLSGSAVEAQLPLTRKLFFNHLNTASGLTQSQCMFIYGDSQEFCWISSTDGIMRFDGQHIKPYYLSDNNLSQNPQSPFFEDKNTDLWFSTEDALVQYCREGDSLRAYFFPSKNPDRSAESKYYVFHFEPQKNRLWLSMNHVLYWVDIGKLGTKEHALAFKRVGPIQGDRCRVVTNSSGTVYRLYTFDRITGGAPGFWAYRMQQGDLLFIGRYLDGSGKSPVVSVKSICAMPDGRLWLATNKGMLEFDLASDRAKFHNQINSDITIAKADGIVCENSNKIWVGTNEGLAAFSLYNQAYTEFYPIIENSPAGPAARIYDLYLDRHRVLWCTINFVGVDFASLDKPKFDFLQIPEKRAPLFVPTTLEEDKMGNLWFGSDMQYLKRWNRFGPHANTLTEMAPYRAALIKRLPSGQTLVLAYEKTFVWDLTGNEYPVYSEVGESVRFDDVCINLAENTIYAINSDSAGCVWQIIPKLGGRYFLAKKVNWKLPKKEFDRIQIDSANRLYLPVNSKSVLIYSIARDSVVFIRETSAIGWTKAVFEGRKYIWAVGTYGLCRINKDNLKDTLIQEKDGLPNNSVYGILQEDDTDFLWISTNQGLIRFHPDTFGFRQYTLADGLQDWEYNRKSFLKDSDGKMWFGGIKGFNVFDPANREGKLKNLQVLPPVYITRIRVNDEPYDPRGNVTLLDSLILEPNENTFSFDFAAPEFSDPANTKLRYQLRYAEDNKPYDPDWLYCETAQGFARYAKLEHGQYYFYAQGANSDGVWSDKVRKIYIEVKPRFTETLQFYILLAVCLIALSYIGVRLYIANKLRLKNLQLREQSLHIEKQEALTQERNRIAGEMHDDLGGGLTSIRMLSERVQRKIDNPEVRISVDKISAYSQDLVLKMSEIIWAMNSNFDTLDNLISYIRNYAVKYLDENNIRCSVQRPDDLPDITLSGERRRNLYLAVKESLHNIVKHAQADRVNLEFTLNSQLVVQIHDNGIGIDPQKLNQFGNGLNNMRKRMESVGGSMLIDQQNGTRILFKIPVKPDNP